MSRREILAILVAAALAGLLGLGLGMARYGLGPLTRTSWGQPVDPVHADSPRFGDPAPRFTVTDFRGRALALPRPGRVQLLSYWASWCMPCREEMPLLSTYAAQQGDNGVELVGIALDDYRSAQGFLDKLPPLAFTNTWERPESGNSSALMGNASGVLPYFVLIDAQGRLRARHVGSFGALDELEDWVAGSGVDLRPAGSARTAAGTP